MPGDSPHPPMPQEYADDVSAGYRAGQDVTLSVASR